MANEIPIATEYTSTLQLFDCLTEFHLNKPKFTEQFLKLQPEYLQAYAIKLAQKLNKSDYLQQDILLDPIELINLFRDNLLINKSMQMKQLSNIVRMTIQLFDENQSELLADFYMDIFENGAEETVDIIEKYLTSYLVIYDMIMSPYGIHVFETIVEKCLFNDIERIQQSALIFLHSILNDVRHPYNIKPILIGLIIRKFTGYQKKQCLQSIIVLDFIFDYYLKYNQNRSRSTKSVEIECIWKCLLDNILSEQMFIRKTVISILKKIVTNCANSTTSTIDFDFPYTFQRHNNGEPTMTTTTNMDTLPDWDNFFTIVYSLISNHSHLVMPTLLNLNYTNGLPRYWFYQLMCLILKNDNDQILNVGLQYILHKLSVETDERILNSSIFENYIYTVLGGLNSTQFYSSDRYTFKRLTHFIENYFNIILKCLNKFDIKWRSKPYFLIIMAFREYKQKITIPNVAILIANTKKIQDIAVRELTMTFITEILENIGKPWDTVSYFQLDFDLSRVSAEEEHDFMLNQGNAKQIESERIQIITSNDVLLSNKILYLQYIRKCLTLDELAQIFDSMIKSKSTIIHILYEICKESVEMKQFLYNKTKEYLMTFCNQFMELPAPQSTDNTADMDYIQMNISLYKLFLNLKDITDNKPCDLLVNINYHFLMNIDNNKNTTYYYKYFFVNVLQEIFAITQELNVFIIDSLKMVTLKCSANNTVYTNESVRTMEGNTKRILLHLHIKLAASLCNDDDDDNYFNFESILSSSIQLIDEHQHPEDLILILKCIKARNIKINEKYIKFIDHIYKYMIENIFVNNFNEILTLFIEIVYCTTCTDEQRIDYQTDYINEIMTFSNKKHLLLYTIMKLLVENPRLLQVWNEKVPDIIVTALTFDKKLNGELKYNAELIKANKCGLICEYNDDVLVRKNAFHLLHSQEDMVKHYKAIEKILLSKFEQLSKSKPRYYLDSFHHRLKLRILQALSHLYIIQDQAVITPPPLEYWDSSVLLNGILVENNLPNILLLLESIIALKMNPQDIFDILARAKTPQSLRSIILIMYQMCEKDKNNIQYVEKCIDCILPWTMSDNFETRFIAQSVMIKLLRHNNNNGDDNKHSVLYKGINEATLIAARKNSSNKIDLELNLLNCQIHLRFQNCFYRSVVSSTTTTIIEPINNNNHNADNIYGRLSLLLDLPIDVCKMLYGIYNIDLIGDPKKVMFGNYDIDDGILIGNESDGERFNNVQAKIIPLEKHLKLNKLIVVASLVTRMSNLGGLARSCEVFGVHKLVMNSVKYVNDKEFKALSMSAEKWLNFKEIKSDKLIEYIIKKRNAGYTIVGAEQTIKSRKIQDVQFPEKTILLLGDEKNGIPPHLLALLDQAIEIPQFGIIPSLNVHVTGALFMWEYAKQFNL